MSLATFIQASAHKLDAIPDGSIQAIVTSPPYYGLRAYAGEQAIEWPAVEYAPMPGLPALVVPGCDPGCAHEWQDGPVKTKQEQRDHNGRDFGNTRGLEPSRVGGMVKITQGAYCAKCGGWRGGLGNEPTLEAYIGHLILIAREAWRVLRGDGVSFWNFGDSYADKQLQMVPARFALAAQADGWWLRSDIIGHKIAPMPESVTDRPTRSHEHIFMLTKASRYFWDGEAVKETAVKGAAGSTFTNGKTGINGMGRVSQLPRVDDTTGRNMRDVIEWRPSPFPGAHFAVWPEAIPEKLIRAATSERGACPACGAPWVRLVDTVKSWRESAYDDGGRQTYGPGSGNQTVRPSNGGMSQSEYVTTGWAPSCACPPADPIPCTVLDPFSGSGTTAKVAVRLGRRAIGVDISAEYLNDVTAARFGDGVQMELTGL